MRVILAIAISLFSVSSFAVDTIQLGAYSGKIGYSARFGVDFKARQDVIAMNTEVAKKLHALKFEKLGELKTCKVDGLQQGIGYTLFDVISCDK